MPTLPKQGSCLCGAMRYQLSGPLLAAEHCHCAMCRKAHGAAFSSNATVAAADFAWLSGAELLSEYASSPQRLKGFCSRCGAQLLIRRLSDPTMLVICLGSLDSPAEITPARHVFCDSKADWYELDRQLPRFRIYPGYEPTE